MFGSILKHWGDVMSVKSYDYPETAPGRRQRNNRPGMIDGPAMERALIALLHILAWLLVALSVLGTFYGMRSEDAPVSAPSQVLSDLYAAPSMLLAAILLQGLLSVVQWGSRQIAMTHNRRWWLLYFAALALSVYWNWQAYGDPLIALGVPWLLTFGLVVGGDVLPEWAIVRD